MNLTDRERMDLATAVYAHTAYPPPSGEHDLSSVRNWVEQAVERIVAERLIGLAVALPALTEGCNREGTARWPERDRGIYSLAIEEAQSAIREWPGART